jgi:hypothetical protein
MTRKDYQKIAIALKDAAIRQARWTQKGELDKAEGAMFDEVVRSLSYMLKQDNSNFRADTFNEAVYGFKAEIKGTREALADNWSRDIPFEEVA